MQVTELNGAAVVRARHVYADENTYQVSAVLVDDDGATSVAAFTVAVNNVAPRVEGGPNVIVAVGQQVELPALFKSNTFDASFGALQQQTIAGSFVDLGAADTHSATPMMSPFRSMLQTQQYVGSKTTMRSSMSALVDPFTAHGWGAANWLWTVARPKSGHGL